MGLYFKTVDVPSIAYLNSQTLFVPPSNVTCMMILLTIDFIPELDNQEYFSSR